MPVKPMYRSFLQNNRHIWAFLLVLGLGVGVQAQSLVNTAHVVDSAGGASESKSYSNISAIGQSFGFNENSSASYVNQGVFVIRGKVGGKYEVQYHTGDNNWQVREVVTLQSNRQLYIDSSSYDEKRFYRVKLVE